LVALWLFYKFFGDQINKKPPNREKYNNIQQPGNSLLEDDEEAL
jgi:hypothetical protein